MAEDILGLSPEVIAALLGVALGLFGERLMRAWGRLRCDAYGWEIRYVGERPRWEGEIPAEEAEYRAHGVEYRVSIDLFNGKEVPTGLRDISIALVRWDGGRLTSQPADLLSTRRDELVQHAIAYSEVNVINIPPRQFIRYELAGNFDRDGAVALATKQCGRVEFVGERPKRPLLGHKTYRKTITTLAPFPDPWARQSSK